MSRLLPQTPHDASTDEALGYCAASTPKLHSDRGERCQARGYCDLGRDTAVRANCYKRPLNAHDKTFGNSMEFRNTWASDTFAYASQFSP